MAQVSHRHIGFTGTRDGLTERQTGALFDLLCTRLRTSDREVSWWLHHGCCQGADAIAHAIARELGIKPIGHPPADTTWQADGLVDFWKLYSALPYLERNRMIVEYSAELIACPAGPERLHSGTWSTVRYSKLRARPARPVTIIWPSGLVDVSA